MDLDILEIASSESFTRTRVSNLRNGSFKRQSFEVEGQTTTVVSIEERALSMLVPLLQLSEVPRFPLTTRVSGGVGKRDDAIDVRSADAREVVEESIRLWMLPPSSDFGLPRG